MELIKLPLSDFQKQAVQHACGVGSDYTHVVSPFIVHRSKPQGSRVTYAVLPLVSSSHAPNRLPLTNQNL